MYTNNVALRSFIQKVGEENNLSFSRCEFMKYLALGLDGEQRKLAIVQQISNEGFDWRLINLDNIQTHFVKKTYKNLNASDLKRGMLEEHLEKITLFIELENSDHPVEAIFYNHNEHNMFELSEIEQTAKDWEIIISKSLLQHMKYRNTSQNHKSEYWLGY